MNFSVSLAGTKVTNLEFIRERAQFLLFHASSARSDQTVVVSSSSSSSCRFISFSPSLFFLLLVLFSRGPLRTLLPFLLLRLCGPGHLIPSVYGLSLSQITGVGLGKPKINVQTNEPEL